MRRRTVVVILGVLAFAVFGAPARAADRIRIVSLEPARTDSMLFCTLHTTGLPDPPSRETLASGLPSAVIVMFTVTDGAGHDLGGSRAEIRIEPDLWEQVFTIRTPLYDRRVPSLGEVAERMSVLGPLPVLPADGLPGRSGLEVRARLAVHPLAASEVRKVRSLFGGNPDADDAGRTEVSVGLGSLIRFFLGGEPDEDWAAVAVSDPFGWLDLPEGP